MSGTVGIFMIGFGIIWTVIAGSLFPPMALFGILWTGIAVVITVYNFKNATNKNRYSTFDIVDGDEEPDPLNERYGNTDAKFCPFCGEVVKDEYEYCHKCGKKLP